MTLRISNGLINRPQKVVIYGPEGIGKSTLAADFPGALIADTEGGTAHMNVCRVDWGSTWDDLLKTVEEVASSKGVCETFVLDTADWAEQLCVQHVLESHPINGKPAKGIEDYGYGKGYTYVAEEFAKLLAGLNKVIANGINVVVTAHAKMRKFEQPDEIGAYDRWEMKLSKQAMPLLKEWADMILFCNYQTHVVTTENKNKKAQGGKRVMYTTHHPCWDAKNRHGLPDKLDMTYFGPLQEAIEGGVKDTRPDPVVPEKKDAPKEAPKKESPKKETVKKAPAPEKKPADDPPIPEAVKKILMEKEPEEGIEFPFKTPLGELKYRANLAGIELGEIQQACIKKKLRSPDQFIEEYDPDFIQRVLLDKWDGFKNYLMKNKGGKK